MILEEIQSIFKAKVKGDTYISHHIKDCMLCYEDFTLEVINIIKDKFNKGIADIEDIEQERVNKKHLENKQGFICRQYITSKGNIYISYSMQGYDLIIMSYEAFNTGNFDLVNLSEV